MWLVALGLPMVALPASPRPAFSVVHLRYRPTRPSVLQKTAGQRRVRLRATQPGGEDSLSAGQMEGELYQFLRKTFCRACGDDVGLLTKVEYMRLMDSRVLYNGLQEFGICLSQRELAVAFSTLDANGDGRVSPEEFVRAVSAIQEQITNEDRKLRFAVDGILNRQETLRRSLSFRNIKVWFSLSKAVGLGLVAVLLGTRPGVSEALLPALSSMLVVSAASSEGSGMQSKGTALYNTALTMERAMRSERIVAEAEASKAFMPFGVGLTAVAAAACVALKFFDEGALLHDIFYRLGFLQVDLDDSLLFFFAAVAVVTAVLTSQYRLDMRTKLRLCASDNDEEALEAYWKDQSGFPLPDATPGKKERLRDAIITVLLCLAPLPLAPAVVQTIGTPELSTELAVVVSATAAAQAALTLVNAEKEFADVERNVSRISKIGNLAELFAWQTAAEAAGLSVSTAVNAAFLGGSAVFVEFSRFMAALFPLGSIVPAVEASVGSFLSRLEARATWVERTLVPTRRSTDVVSSSWREILRIQDELTVDPFYMKVQKKLNTLPVGATYEFPRLQRDQRRKVHIVSSRLGLASQSADSMVGRIVRVTNLGGKPPSYSVTPGLALSRMAESAREELTALANDLQDLLDQASIDDYRPAIFMTASAAFLSAASPLLFGNSGAELVIPLVTGALSLEAIEQERKAALETAEARRYAATVAQVIMEAKRLVGKAILGYAHFTVYSALATCTAAFATWGCCGASWLAFTFGCAPALPVSVAVFLLALRRLHLSCELLAEATALVEGPPLPTCGLRRWSAWLVVAGLILMATPSWGFRRSVALSCVVLCTGVAALWRAMQLQLARCENYVARAVYTFACTDGWAQYASRALRLLPFESAAATVGTLLSTALVGVSTPIAAAFPALGFNVCLRALELRAKASEGYKGAKEAVQALQRRPGGEPWEGQVDDVELVDRRPYRGFSSLLRSPIVAMLRGLRVRAGSGALRLWEWLVQGQDPDSVYKEGPAEIAVKNVQSDLDELYTTRLNQSGVFSSTLGVLGTCTVASLMVPPLLPPQATEVVLPVLGAGIAMFTVAEESESLRQVSVAKLRAAELGAVVALMEEALTLVVPSRGQLVVAAVGSASVALAVFALSSLAQHNVCWRVIMLVVVVAQALLAGWSTGPLHTLWCSASQVLGITSTYPRRPATPAIDIETEIARSAIRWGPQATPPHRRMWFVLTAVPALFVGLVPWGRSVAKRAIASTALSAGLIGIMLLLAEASVSSAERAVAERGRTAALTDAFSNEAEQQGVILPVVSSTAVALSAIITFLVELNPIAASACTVLQTLAWVLASRKGIAAKYESAAALQVDAVTERPP